jgi:hypothetical protein
VINFNLFVQDWDSNGEIDFPEFVQAFSGWVNIDEEEFDEDERM